MKRSALIIFALAIICPAAESRVLSLRYFLNDLGKNRDCYFTVELLGPRMGERAVLMETENKDVPLAKVIEAALPGFKLMRYRHSDRVYALVEINLTKLDGYGMDELESPNSYAGTPAGLLRILEGRHPSITPRKEERMEDMRTDMVTPIKFSYDKSTVREVLTQGLPVENYSRIMWIADTHIVDGRHETHVVLQGPAQR